MDWLPRPQPSFTAITRPILATHFSSTIINCPRLSSWSSATDIWDICFLGIPRKDIDAWGERSLTPRHQSSSRILLAGDPCQWSSWRLCLPPLGWVTEPWRSPLTTQPNANHDGLATIFLLPEREEENKSIIRFSQDKRIFELNNTHTKNNCKIQKYMYLRNSACFYWAPTICQM